MSESASLWLKLTSIMEVMSKSAIIEICKIVESDFSLLRQELTYVMSENRALKDKMNYLESNAENKSISIKQAASKTYQNMCVQTEGAQPSIRGIFGKEWCSSLWDCVNVDMHPESHKHEPNKSSKPLIKKEKIYEVDTYTNCKDKVSFTSEGHFNGEPLGDSRKHNHFQSVDSSNEHTVLNAVTDNNVDQFITSIEDPLKFDDLCLLDTFSVEQNIPCSSETQTEKTFQELYATNPENYESRSDVQNLPGQDGEIVKPTFRYYRRNRFLCQTQQTRKHKQQLPLRVSKSKPYRRHHCEICGKDFYNKTSLKNHSVVHTGEKPYKCSFCGKGFSQKAGLQCHERIHRGEKPFTCETCGRGFTQKVSLQNHKRIHSGERPFPCEICGKAFIQKIHLENHLIVHDKTRKKRSRKRSPFMAPPDFLLLSSLKTHH